MNNTTNYNLAPAGNFRASWDEKQTVIEELIQAFTDGRINEAELDNRTNFVTNATTTEEIGRVLQDIPNHLKCAEKTTTEKTKTGKNNPTKSSPKKAIKKFYRGNKILLKPLIVFAVFVGAVAGITAGYSALFNVLTPDREGIIISSASQPNKCDGVNKCEYDIVVKTPEGDTIESTMWSFLNTQQKNAIANPNSTIPDEVLYRNNFTPNMQVWETRTDWSTTSYIFSNPLIILFTLAVPLSIILFTTYSIMRWGWFTTSHPSGSREVAESALVVLIMCTAISLFSNFVFVFDTFKTH